MRKVEEDEDEDVDEAPAGRLAAGHRDERWPAARFARLCACNRRKGAALWVEAAREEEEDDEDEEAEKCS